MWSTPDDSGDRRKSPSRTFRPPPFFHPNRHRARVKVPRVMMYTMLDREQAWNILCEFTKSEGLRKHALAVETCVTAYARKFGEDEAKWSVTAILHDFDWEIHPQLPDHPVKG